MIRMSPKEAARYGLHARGIDPQPQHIELALPFPPTVNTYWRHVNGKTLISQKGRAYRREVACCVQSEFCTGSPFQGKLRVTIRFTMPDKRARDIDNLPKALLDSLTHAGVWEDDSQIDELTLHRGNVAPPGAAYVTIERMEE